MFFTSLISLICIFVHSNRNAYKVIDLGFYNALIGALMLWIFTMRYRSGGNDTREYDVVGNNGNGPTLA